MKKLFFIIMAMAFLSAPAAYAGMVRETPRDIVLTDPLTHSVELISQEYYYSSTAPYVEIKFNIITNAGNAVKEHTLRIEAADFTAFTSGFLSTMVSRGDTYTWAYIQSLYSTQAR